MLKYVLLAILVLAAIGIANAFLSKGRTRKYVKRDLFSPAELNFYKVLEQAVGNKLKIFPKIRLADIVKVDGGLDKSEHQSAFNRIQSKHVDFVLCNLGDMSVACVVELDDKSHNAASRIARDEFVDSALESAGIPIAHLAARRQYSTDDIANAISSCMEPKPQKENPEGLKQKQAELPTCSQCGAPMVLRTTQKGGQAEKSFYGCSTYPKCRNTVQVTGAADAGK